VWREFGSSIGRDNHTAQLYPLAGLFFFAILTASKLV
jgi:hypothetical protein